MLPQICPVSVLVHGPVPKFDYPSDDWVWMKNYLRNRFFLVFWREDWRSLHLGFWFCSVFVFQVRIQIRLLWGNGKAYKLKNRVYFNVFIFKAWCGVIITRWKCPSWPKVKFIRVNFTVEIELYLLRLSLCVFVLT